MSEKGLCYRCNNFPCSMLRDKKVTVCAAFRPLPEDGPCGHCRVLRCLSRGRAGVGPLNCNSFECAITQSKTCSNCYMVGCAMRPTGESGAISHAALAGLAAKDKAASGLCGNCESSPCVRQLGRDGDRIEICAGFKPKSKTAPSVCDRCASYPCETRSERPGNITRCSEFEPLPGDGPCGHCRKHGCLSRDIRADIGPLNCASFECASVQRRTCDGCYMVDCDLNQNGGKESDPNGVDQHAPGAKLDQGKLLAGIIQQFPRALTAVLEVGTFGVKKYSRGGWQHVENGVERYNDAMFRHLLKEPLEKEDPDSGLRHEAHAAWNALAKLELILRGD